jgi:hypothetical protein
MDPVELALQSNETVFLARRRVLGRAGGAHGDEALSDRRGEDGQEADPRA